ncbi:MAG: hypothetical protein Q8L10_04700 [Candidatus Moranbacteria bacterium]|nr:hypothetical protein [Candidatus Moranbacteria bacterium]
MPLEPIEEKDLDMKSKFIESGQPMDNTGQPEQPDDAFAAERNIERQEGAVEKDDTYTKIVSKIKTQSPPTDDADVKKDADELGKEMDADSRINNLVDIAMQKGVVHAVKVAQRINDNYILDGLHDRLMLEEFHDALMEKGLIEEL